MEEATVNSGSVKWLAINEIAHLESEYRAGRRSLGWNTSYNRLIYNILTLNNLLMDICLSNSHEYAPTIALSMARDQ